jgi:hypothetical protein
MGVTLKGESRLSIGGFVEMSDVMMAGSFADLLLWHIVPGLSFSSLWCNTTCCGVSLRPMAHPTDDKDKEKEEKKKLMLAAAGAGAVGLGAGMLLAGDDDSDREEYYEERRAEEEKERESGSGSGSSSEDEDYGGDDE